MRIERAGKDLDFINRDPAVFDQFSPGVIADGKHYIHFSQSSALDSREGPPHFHAVGHDGRLRSRLETGGE